MKGKVKFYNRTKRFGFIIGDDGNDYFVHQSGLAEGTRINDEDAVMFTVVDGERGPKAEEVKLDKGGASKEPAPEVEEAEAEEVPEPEPEEEPAKKPAKKAAKKAAKKKK